MGGVTIKLEGIGDVIKTFDELAQEIGDKKARSKILIPAARDAMRPVLAQAKGNAPKDTGALFSTLIIEARRPNNRDRRSKYIKQSDAVIAAVTTKAFPKKLAKQFYKENENLYKTDKKEYKKKLKDLKKEMNFPYDARAIAQEFGTGKMPAQPYLRPALESQSQDTVNRLADGLRKYILKFRAKT